MRHAIRLPNALTFLIRDAVLVFSERQEGPHSFQPETVALCVHFKFQHSPLRSIGLCAFGSLCSLLFLPASRN
jgi:hypothetical protein